MKKEKIKFKREWDNINKELHIKKCHPLYVKVWKMDDTEIEEDGSINYSGVQIYPDGVYVDSVWRNLYTGPGSIIEGSFIYIGDGIAVNHRGEYSDEW